ncbi:acyl carrier protein [Agrobacterium vitis]|nr:acyl carrier protein [Agrobacterium vitis]MBE1436643.1 acyl carrier protein [Agrobacterium vitis]
MKDEIIELMADFLDVKAEDLQEHKTLGDLNIDSLDFIEIMFEIEEKYDAPILSDIQKHRDEMRNLGDVLRLTELLITKHRQATPGQAHG